MKIKITFLITLLLLNTHSFAAGWYHNTKITSVYLLDSNRAIVKLSTVSGGNKCSLNDSGDVFFIPSSNQEWYSALLAAYMSEKNVSIYYTDDCIAVWAGTSYANIGHVRLH